jgi:hypothetical protein
MDVYGLRSMFLRFSRVLRNCSTERFSHQNCNEMRHPWTIFHHRTAIASRPFRPTFTSVVGGANLREEDHAIPRIKTEKL